MAEMQNRTETWERQIIHDLLFEYSKEQKRRRRWGIFFKIIWVLIFLALIWALIPTTQTGTDHSEKLHVGLIDIRGLIFDNTDTSADKIAASLNDALSDKKTVAVILRINSPGGSPVQASYLFNEINRQRKLHPKVKIYAVCSDICASAAYYIAAAADEIYANPSSLVGSIGVLFNGFGFVDTLQKIGGERRLLTAGDHKGMLDPFSPMPVTDKDFMKVILNIAHQQFIENVKKGRGNRLRNDPQIFSGLVWSGVQAKDLGLVDGLASPGEVARNIIKNDNVVDYTTKPNVFEQITKHLGASFAGEIATRAGLTSTTLR